MAQRAFVILASTADVDVNNELSIGYQAWLADENGQFLDVLGGDADLTASSTAQTVKNDITDEVRNGFDDQFLGVVFLMDTIGLL